MTAAYLLSKAGVKVDVFEASANELGGISRTVVYKGFRFDIGGHRFFSKSQEIEALWREILPDGIITRDRLSRILYRNKFYSYPLQSFEVLNNLGLIQSFLCLTSYLLVKVKDRLGLVPKPSSFEDWIVYNFGHRLYLTFFKTYTEKVWGKPCSEISADWAVQRIRGLSLRTTAITMLRSMLQGNIKRTRSKQIKTLITAFRYPRLGPGMMWEAAADHVRTRGGNIHFSTCISGLNNNQQDGTWHLQSSDGRCFGPYHHVISSAPLSAVIPAISKTLPAEVVQAATSLRYRDFILVALILEADHTFDDQWLYIHDADLQVGRIQNFRNWSPDMLDGSGRLCYGMEYFCFEGDALWQRTDQQLIDLATHELISIGLARPSAVMDGCVVRQAKAYPVYDDDYQQRIDLIKGALIDHCPGLHQVGRNGMHRYNNQDHSMMTAILVAKGILDPQSALDPWCVNQDAEYIEADSADQPNTT